MGPVDSGEGVAAAVCVCGRGIQVGMSTPPHATPKRIMHIESIDSVCWLGARL